jgi:hypothetical protein
VPAFYMICRWIADHAERFWASRAAKKPSQTPAE